MDHFTSGSGRDVTDHTIQMDSAVGHPQHANSTNSSSSNKVCYAWHMNGGSMVDNGVKSEGGGTVSE